MDILDWLMVGYGTFIGLLALASLSPIFILVGLGLLVYLGFYIYHHERRLK